MTMVKRNPQETWILRGKLLCRSALTTSSTYNVPSALSHRWKRVKVTVTLPSPIQESQLQQNNCPNWEMVLPLSILGSKSPTTINWHLPTSSPFSHQFTSPLPSPLSLTKHYPSSSSSSSSHLSSQFGFASKKRFWVVPRISSYKVSICVFGDDFGFGFLFF